MASGPALAPPTSSEVIQTTSAGPAPVTPRTSARPDATTGMPSLDRAPGETSVRSAPVSRTSVMGPRPLMRALTITGEPGVKVIVVSDDRSIAGTAGGGEAKSGRARERKGDGKLSMT